MNPSASGRQFLRTLSLLALSISVMFAIDTFLAKTEESETRAEAARLYREGQALLQQGRPNQAEDDLKNAVAIERKNRDYQLALAQTQLDSHEFADAEATLNSLLLADSTDGPANLSMARVLAEQGRTREAISFYHRAVYGSWTSNTAANRLKVRFELIDLLARQNSKEELLAELLAVEDQAPADPTTRLRIANLFLAGGSPARAVTEFQLLLKNQPENAAARAGLGEADFSKGDYRAAIADFSAALRLNPDDQTSAKRLDLSNRVLALDPTRRGLDAPERFRRSRVVLQMALDSVQACPKAIPAVDLLDKADQSLKQRGTPLHADAAAESNLDLAEQLWQSRPASCPTADGDPLPLVLAKTAQ